MALKTNLSRKDFDTKDGFEYAKTVLELRTDPCGFLEKECGVEFFPAQREIMMDFYQNKYNPSKTAMRHLILACGMRSGKTALCGMFGAIEMLDICTLPDPSKHYHLLKGQGIALLALATSLDQALEGVFNNTVNIMENSDWIQSWMDFKIKTDMIDCPSKNVFFKALGSWASTAVGRSAKAVFFDELDNFEDSTSKRGATEVYSRVRNATDTLGDDGHTFALSSLKSPTGIMMNLCKDAEQKRKELGDKCNTIAYIRPTWEMNPHFTKEMLMAEHSSDISAFWRDFGCQPSVWNSMAFPTGVVLTPMQNVLLYPPPTKEGQPVRFMSIDPAVKKDGFGIACGYKAPSGQIIIDGAHKFTKKEGNIMIMPSEIRAHLNKVMPTLNVKLFIHDTWMYSDILEDMIRRGIKTEQHFVDYDTYSLWLDLEKNNKLKVVYNSDLEGECNKLAVFPGKKPKVDHPLTGSKDMADAVANTIWYLYSNKSSFIPRMTGLRGF